MRAVIIGGGIAGAAISRVLARKGVEVLLLEKSGQLCSGATWHAAGLVTRFAGSAKLKRIHVRSLDLLEEVHDAHDVNLKLPGSIRVVEKGNPDRLAEAMQHLAMARLFDKPGLATEVIGPDRIAELHPLIDVANVECGLWTPRDGYVDPTMLTTAVAKEARDAGATIRFRAEASAVSRGPDGRFVVTTADGEDLAPADVVVNAAGLWSRNVTRMAEGMEGAPRMSHPAFVIEHQYAVTEALPELVGAVGNLPVLRDLAGSSYIRQEQKGLLVGPYEDECVVRTEWRHGPPDTWGMELFPDNLERITPNIAAAIELIPVLGEVGFKTVVNGPTIWTGDSLPRCGRTSVPGWFDFNTLTYGIAQSLALAEYLGDVILTGDQPFDATDYFDPLRYSDKHTDEYAVSKIAETYTHNNRVVFPYENRPGGLDHLRQAPVIQQLADMGAHLGAAGAGGVTAPLVYDARALGAGSLVRGCRRFSDFEWAHHVQHEADAVLEGAAVGYSSFSKIHVRGEGAVELLGAATTAVIPTKANAFRLTYALTSDGRVHSEYSVCRRDAGRVVGNNGDSGAGNGGNGDNGNGNGDGDGGEPAFYLVGSRDHAAADTEWLRRCARELGLAGVAVEDASDAIEVLHVAGPGSRSLLAGIEPDVGDVGFFTGRDIADFGGLGVSVLAVCMSFTGEQGYELHVGAADAPRLMSALASTGAPLFGGLALNSLRIEKGFMVRADFDYAHYTECGIDRFVSKKQDFIGKATESFRDKRAVLMSVDAAAGWEWSVVGDSPIVSVATGDVVGYTTTAAKGARTGRAVARGFLERGVEPEECVLETFGHRWPLETLDPM